MLEISKKKFGTLLKGHMIDANLRQNEIAKKVGISASVVSYYTSGATYPSLGTFVKLCNLLDLTPDEFFQIPALASNTHAEKKEKTEWVLDADSVYYCKSCRMDAPRDSVGVQHRTRWCPYCGREVERK